MGVEPLSLGNVAGAAIAAVLGAYELTLHRQRERDHDEHLWVAIICAAATLHSFALVLHYNVTAVASAVAVSRVEGVALITICHVLPLLAAAIRRQPLPFRRRWLLASALLWFGFIVSPWMIVDCHERTMWGLGNPFLRRTDTPLVLLAYAQGYVMGIASLVWLLRSRERDRLIATGVGIWLAAAGVDMLSGLLLTPHLPLSFQYGFIGFALTLVARHARDHAEGYARVRRRFAQFLEAAPEGILVLRGHAIVFANPAFRSLVGATDRKTSKLVESLPESTWSALDERLRSEAPNPMPLEVSLCHADGTEVEVEATVINAELDGDEGHMLLFRDVSARRAITAKLVEVDRMVTIGSLAAGVGHELNNPLSYVLLNLEEARRGAADDEQRSRIEAAHDGATRMRDIIASLRAFSRSEADDRQPVAMSRCIEAAINLTRNEVSQRAELRSELQEVPFVLGSETGLGQVFVNLLQNAAQAFDGPRTDAQVVWVRLWAEGGRVQFEVEDTAGGVDPTIAPRIFDPFFTTKLGSGTGLGLALCRETLRRFGGDLELLDGDRGALFRGFVPATDERPAAASRQPSIVPAAGRPRILLVDDERELRRALARSLRRHADVVACADGDEALEALRDHPFDLVLSDLLMPHRSGMALYADACAMDPTFRDRFVFMTGGAFTPEAKAFVEGVPCPVLDKPVDQAELRRLLRLATASQELELAAMD